MLLSIQQKYILEVLRELGCIRRRQLLVLLREKFRRPDLVISQARLDAMLRQLRCCAGDVRVDEELVRLYAAEPDEQFLEAIDVMLELTQGTPKDLAARLPRPLLLRFTLGGEKVRFFTVAELTDPLQITQGLLERHRMERIVWISGDRFPDGVPLPSKHFFAVRQEDGTHRFYGSNKP